MEQNKFEAMLILLIPQVIKEITDTEGISELEATKEFYSCELYAALEDEQTKLWHLSPKALYQLYNEEKTCGEINWPQEA